MRISYDIPRFMQIPLSLVLFLCILDVWLTAFFLTFGGQEGSPLLLMLMKGNPMWMQVMVIAAVKLLMVGIALLTFRWYSNASATRDGKVMLVTAGYGVALFQLYAVVVGMESNIAALGLETPVSWIIEHITFF